MYKYPLWIVSVGVLQRQHRQAISKGTARDHDLLHRDDPSEVHEAMVGLAHACSVGILVGVVVVVVEFLV